MAPPHDPPIERQQIHLSSASTANDDTGGPSSRNTIGSGDSSTNTRGSDHTVPVQKSA
jgi:hypothetical protein